jgi:hypothetical protein
MRMVERDVEGRARVPGGAEARMRAVQALAASGRGPGTNDRGNDQNWEQETSPHVLLPTRDRRAG